MMIIPHDGEESNAIQSKLEQLRDFPAVDIDTQLLLWKETFHFRRQSVRNRSTTDILNDFPGHRHPLLVGESFI